MNEYIRTTSNFNNETREWYVPSHKDMNHWNELDKKTKELGHPLWSFGVHALENGSWRYMRSIIDNTIDLYTNGGADHLIKKEFEEFVKNTPNYREIIKRDILKEFEILIASGDVMVKDNGQPYMEYWDN